MNPSLRFDVTTGDWVVLAGDRAARPDQRSAKAAAKPPSPPDYEPGCPFCLGNESQLAAIVDEEPDPADPTRWSVRLVENKYPALRSNLAPERRVHGPLFRELAGHGRHEVLIESPHHGLSLAQQPPEQIQRVLSVLHRRCQALASDRRLEVVQIFKNSGAAAGSSQAHSHFQLIATPVVPRQVRIKFQTAAEHYQVTGNSIYVELCRAELEAGSRLIAVNDDYVAFSPYASRTPYETWILPRNPAPTFDLAAASTLPALASLLGDVLRRVRSALDDPPYNIVVNSAPRRHADEPDFVWHVELIPRLNQAAGFELATGMPINEVPPELAAQTLRDARVD